MTDRHIRMGEVIRQLAAEFLSRESNRTSLITITNVDLAKNLRNAIILISVFPEDKEDYALEFVKRRRDDFKEYVKQHSKLKRIPYFKFEIDRGEKNRRRIDTLLSE